MDNNSFITKIPNLLYICGHRGSGKTYVLIQLLLNPNLYYQKYDKIFVFSPSLLDKNDGSLFDLLNLPRCQVFSNFKEELLNGLIKKKKRFQEQQWLIILDDCITDIKNSHLMKIIATNGRHMGLSMWITSQKSTLGSTVIRTNADMCILFRPRSGNEIDALFRDSCINAISKKQFTKLLIDNTMEKHSFLAINYTNNTVWKNFTMIETPTLED